VNEGWLVGTDNLGMGNRNKEGNKAYGQNNFIMDKVYE
jgi:hypothetical protein